MNHLIIKLLFKNLALPVLLLAFITCSCGVSAQDNAANYKSYNPANQMTGRDLSNSLYAYTGDQNQKGAYVVNGLNQYTSVNGKTFCGILINRYLAQVLRAWLAGG